MQSHVITRHRMPTRPRVVPIPVSPAERDAFVALERQGVDRDLLFRIVLPLVRADQRATEGRRLIDYIVRRNTP